MNASAPLDLPAGDEAQAALLASTKLALEVWLTNGWTNPNWYDQEIGVPRQMAEIALLLSGPPTSRGENTTALSSEDIKNMVKLMARANWKGRGSYTHPQVRKRTAPPYFPNNISH
jgi:hypothetical protein